MSHTSVCPTVSESPVHSQVSGFGIAGPVTHNSSRGACYQSAGKPADQEQPSARPCVLLTEQSLLRHRMHSFVTAACAVATHLGGGWDSFSLSRLPIDHPVRHDWRPCSVDLFWHVKWLRWSFLHCRLPVVTRMPVVSVGSCSKGGCCQVAAASQG